jgi:hypothetical protein
MMAAAALKRLHLWTLRNDAASRVRRAGRADDGKDDHVWRARAGAFTAILWVIVEYLSTRRADETARATSFLKIVSKMV